MVFETDNCEPVLHFDEFYNFAVTNVRFLVAGAFAAPTVASWTAARTLHLGGCVA